MKCRTCGADSSYRNYCFHCLQIFLDRKKEAYDLTIVELGKFGPVNFDSFKKRYRQIERKLNAEYYKADPTFNPLKE